MELITHCAALVLGVLIGFWGRKYLGKKDPAALAAADAAVKRAGDKAREQF